LVVVAKKMVLVVVLMVQVSYLPMPGDLQV
jgi:hypothetical protein